MNTKKFQMFYLAILTGMFLFLGSCDDDVLSNDEGVSADRSTEQIMNKESHGKIIHHASLGSNDACESLFGLPPGCDKSFSFVANMYEDGTVKGQWQDGFGEAAGSGSGIHVEIDCMTVNGNSAQVGGFITKGTDAEGNDLTGLYAITKVVDNGTSSNDPADQMSFSIAYAELAPGCNYEYPDEFLFDLTKGQVKVW